MLTHTVAFTANAWHFLCGTWDAAEGTVTLDAAREVTAGGVVAAPRSAYVGARNNTGAADSHISADIGEHGIVNRALTAAEIARLRAQTIRT